MGGGGAEHWEEGIQTPTTAKYRRRRFHPGSLWSVGVPEF